MITEEEIKKISKEKGIPLPYVEKDYVMGWLLKEIYENTTLNNKLVLKGGNCLRKVYFPQTRFSDDLDFTISKLLTDNLFDKELREICKKIQTNQKIDFKYDDFKIVEKETPDNESKAIEGKIYFKGFAGDSSVTMRIKFDLSQYEQIVLPLENHPLIHNYSDRDLCNAIILSYSLEEVLAEKLRSWIQRTRARDLFDIVTIIQKGNLKIDYLKILNSFFKKTIYKNIQNYGKDELLFQDKFTVVEKSWFESLICPAESFIVCNNAISLFKDFINTLFDTAIIKKLTEISNNLIQNPYNFRSGIRESIQKAGRERKLILMKFNNKERIIEPYSFRYRNGKEFFFGYDRTNDNTIKSFTLSNVQNVSITTESYLPRWLVEF